MELERLAIGADYSDAVNTNLSASFFATKKRV